MTPALAQRDGNGACALPSSLSINLVPKFFPCRSFGVKFEAHTFGTAGQTCLRAKRVKAAA